MEIPMILQVTDEDETLVLEFLELEDLKNEGILPNLPVATTDQWS
jgi:hypothetical protein